MMLVVTSQSGGLGIYGDGRLMNGQMRRRITCRDDNLGETEYMRVEGVGFFVYHVSLCKERPVRYSKHITRP